MIKKFFIAVVGLLFGFALALPAHSQDADPLATLIAKYYDAQESGDHEQIVELADRLGRWDFSGSPLTAVEEFEFKAELAQTLWDAGNQGIAENLVRILIAKTGNQIKVTDDKLLRSDLRASLAQSYILWADFREELGEVDGTLANLTKARDHLALVYGVPPDKTVGTFWTNTSDPEVGSIVIEIDRKTDGQLNPLLIELTKRLVGTAMGQIDQTKPVVEKNLVETRRALRYLYLARAYITAQCGAGYRSSKPECAAADDGQSLPTMYENAMVIAEHWRVFARHKMELEQPITAYEALFEAEIVLKFEFVAIESDFIRIISAEKAEAGRAARAAGYVGILRSRMSLMVVGQGDDDEEEYHTVTVFYGTNRAPGKSGNPDKAYTGKRKDDNNNELEYGSIEMTVPKARTLGSVPAKSKRKKQDRSVHIILTSVNKHSRALDFGTALSKSVAESSRDEKEAFVFIHGHSETFASSARRTAQLAIDLDIPHGAIFFSWPAGSVAGYGTSEDAAGLSAVPLAKFLNLVLADSGANKIHIIAHSMGNRVLLRALSHREFQPNEKKFEQIVWASPDVNITEFTDNIGYAAKVARGMTLYASKNDKALKVSRWLHGFYKRAGQAPLVPKLRTGELTGLLTAVDTTIIDRKRRGFISHSDYTNGAITDLRSVVWLSLAPDARCISQFDKSKTDDEDPYWHTNYLEDCPESEYHEALRLLRAENGRSGAHEQVAKLIDDLDAGKAPARLRTLETVKTILEKRFPVPDQAVSPIH